MRKGKMEKFENQVRLDELKPGVTLRSIGIDENSRVLDYGAGTGIFSAAASKMAQTVFAYEIDPEMLHIIKRKIRNEGLSNVDLITKGNLSEIDYHSIDHILLVTVFHEITNLENLFMEFDALLTDDGMITIIDFHKKETPMGPSVDHRIAKEEVIGEFLNRDYRLSEDRDMGENFYLLSFVA